jgi:hypothetical protein
VTDSVRTKIATAITTRLATIAEIKYVSFDEIKMLASDFQDFQLPAVQIIDLGDDNTHERNRAKKLWNITLELVMGSKTTGIVSQKDLWNLLQQMEEVLFADPRLGLTNVIHMVLLGSTTDLHILQPLYTARLDLQILYYQPLVSPC